MILKKLVKWNSHKIRPRLEKRLLSNLNLDVRFLLSICDNIETPLKHTNLESPCYDLHHLTIFTSSFMDCQIQFSFCTQLIALIYVLSKRARSLIICQSCKFLVAKEKSDEFARVNAREWS
ncbi:hypothetical protein AC1031_020822 [Aphanomyces cochlioides]|nr:hypothetical protein AC1031_020822 [Aphanomyces cochlioides]